MAPKTFLLFFRFHFLRTRFPLILMRKMKLWPRSAAASHKLSLRLSPALKYFKSASGSTSYFLFFSFFHLAPGLSLWHKDHNFPGETTVVVGWIELSRRPKVGTISCFFLQSTRVDCGVAKKRRRRSRSIFSFFFVPKRGADSRREKKEINCQINQKANFPSSPQPNESHWWHQKDVEREPLKIKKNKCERAFKFPFLF